MLTFEWKDCYLVGVPRIDQHNQHLFNLIKKLNGLFKEPSDRQRIVLELAEMFDYVVFHFACEEIWMKYTKYVPSIQHQHEHKLITQRLVDIHECFLRRNHPLTKELQVLFRSIIAHIKKYDVKYGNYVNGILPVKSMPQRYQK